MEIEIKKFRLLDRKPTQKRAQFIFDLMCKHKYYSDRALLFFPHKNFRGANVNNYLSQHKSKIVQSRFSNEPKILSCGDKKFIRIYYSVVEISLSQVEKYFLHEPEKVKILIDANVLESSHLTSIFFRNPKILDNEHFRQSFHITIPETRISLGQFLKSVSGKDVDEKNIYWAFQNMVDFGGLRKLSLVRQLRLSGHKYSARKFLDAEIERRREKNKIFMEDVKKIISEMEK